MVLFNPMDKLSSSATEVWNNSRKAMQQEKKQ